MKNKQKESKPAPVPEKAKQAGETLDQWSWVEPTVWTERMLRALEKGVRGGRWHSLIDKVFSERNLKAAFEKVRANKGSSGVDHQTIDMFEKRLDENLAELQVSLRNGTYHPQRIRRVWIPKPGRRSEKRPLGIPTVRDRVVQTALRNVVEPIFERDFAEHSYGFRPGRGCKDALRRVDNLLKEGHTWVVDADLKNYFDTVPHAPLLSRIKKKVADGKVLDLISSFLSQEVMESAASWTPEQGTPQGAVISPLLSNIYLDPLDHMMAAEGFEMVRYADDFVIMCRTESEAQKALRLVRGWTETAKLILHPEKTRLIDATQPGGFEFLGYNFGRGTRWPNKKSLNKLKDTLRTKTKRSDGRSLKAIIQDVNKTLIGWFAYFKHSHRFTFPRLDQWLRMRIRSILRKRRRGSKGRGRGLDHIRWPNAFFAEHGLFSLVAAHAEACQSALR